MPRTPFWAVVRTVIIKGVGCTSAPKDKSVTETPKPRSYPATVSSDPMCRYVLYKTHSLDTYICREFG